MAYTNISCRRALAWSLIIVTITSIPLTTTGREKIRPEELVAKHLEAIGTVEARNSVKSMIMVGEVLATFRAPASAQYSGQAVIASEGSKSMIGMNFASANYSQEKFGYDDKQVTVGYIHPGVRSPLSDFLFTNNAILKEGLLGGTLSDAWPLSNLAGKNPKLEYSGTKKINGRMAHELSYLPHGGSDLQINLFFDAETFQHVRTEYTLSVAAHMGSTIDTSSQERAIRHKLVEDFSDFKKEGGLMLPHTYKLLLELETRSGNYSAEWKLNISQFYFNKAIKPGSFDMNNDPNG